MKQKAKNLMKHPLTSGVLIVFTGGLIANFINFLFSVYMAQNLQVADNGILQTILSMIIFPSLLANAVNPVVIQFAGSAFAKDDFSYLRGLYIKFTKFFVIIASVFCLLYMVNLSNISNFFHIKDQEVLFFAGIIVFLAMVGITNLAFLQAKLAFKFIVSLSFISACSKLFFGIIFVLLGYSVTGAVGGMVIAAIVFYFFSFFQLKFVFHKQIKKVKIDTKGIFKYGIPSALTLFGITSFITTDILLIKHLFDPTNAGLYAGLSLVGKVIFFIGAPISTVMFPIIVRMHANNENFNNTFKLALLFVLVPSVFLTSFYFTFPEFTIMFFLKKTEYLTVAPYVGFYGLYMTFYCLLYLLANFYLSIGKTNVYLPIIFCAVLQIILIYIYHESFFQVIMISFILVLLLVIGFLLYYLIIPKTDPVHKDKESL